MRMTPTDRQRKLAPADEPGFRPQPVTVAIRTCPPCEATCGLAIELDGDRVVRVRGDAEDVFSRGFL
jgi:anaerobic selenocysteine-containing dehydrogenase